jgi:hypothetical protein
MAATSKADIFDGAEDLVIDTVKVPEWKCGEVYVRSLTAEERSAYEGSFTRFGRDGKPTRDMGQVRLARGKLAALGICDEKGRRLFSDDDAHELSRKNARAVDRICDKIAELSGMTDEAVEEEKGN